MVKRKLSAIPMLGLGISILLCPLALVCGGKADATTTVAPEEAPPPAPTGNAKRYLDEITRNYDAIYETNYQTLTQVDEHSRIFNYDCSGLIDYALGRVLPEVYTHFQNTLGVQFGTRLDTEKLAIFFNTIDPTNDPYWTILQTPIDAIPGDVITIRYKEDTNGHVVTVKRNLGYKPGSGHSEVLLEVFDSALSRHSEDSTRYHSSIVPRDDPQANPSVRTGLGFGIMSFRADGSGYRWRGTESDSPLQDVHSLHLARLKAGVPPAVPAAPTNLAAVPGTSQVRLTWTGSPGATSYNLKRSTTDGGPYSAILSGRIPTDWVDTGLTPGATYFYVVSAANSSGESLDSNQISAIPQ